MKINLIGFDMEIGRQKPENIRSSGTACPFCDVGGLTDIVNTADGGIILLKNKYNVLDDADQFVLIETENCGPDLPDYSREHMRRLIKFGVGHWKKMSASGKYSAVIFFRNHGSLSGGTMRHAHMQIIGFRGAYPSLFAERRDFDGVAIAEQDGVILNAATRPRLGFGEFNIVASYGASLDALADFIQDTASFIVKKFPRSDKSYNVFFYELGDDIGVKMMPRFATSPLLIGYGIRILPSNMSELADELRRDMKSKIHG